MMTFESGLEEAKKTLERRFPTHNFKWKKPTKGRIFGLCPQHRELEPSFNIFIKGSEIMYHCFGCGFSGTFDNIELVDFRDVHVTASQTARETGRLYESNFTPLPVATNSHIRQSAMTYLATRGLTENDTVKYNIGVCTDQGTYYGFLAFPFRNDDGLIHFFTARSFLRASTRYLFPPCEKADKVCTYLGAHADHLVLVEGIFDGVNVNKAGYSVLFLFGKFLSDTHLDFIKRSGFRRVTVMLDKDAEKDGRKICKMLLAEAIPVDVVIPPAKDPGEMTADEIKMMLGERGAMELDEIVSMYFKKR